MIDNVSCECADIILAALLHYRQLVSSLFAGNDHYFPSDTGAIIDPVLARIDIVIKAFSQESK